MAWEMYLDGVNGNDGNNGLSMAQAFKTWKFCFEYFGIGWFTGGNLWVRRITDQIPAADINALSFIFDSSTARIIGWPRNSHTINSSDWTQGSPNVTVDDNNMIYSRHEARYITAPDGEVYMITRVAGTSSIVIDRNYVGDTVTNAEAVIHADDEYDEAQALGDPDIDDWNSDPDDMARVNFNNLNRYIIFTSAPFYDINNVRFENNNKSPAIINLNYCDMFQMKGCIMSQPTSIFACVYMTGSLLTLDRCVYRGRAFGSSNVGIRGNTNALVDIKNSAIYNMGGYGIQSVSGWLSNTNIGVEQENKAADIFLSYASSIIGKDVKLGGTNGYIARGTSYNNTKSIVAIENYQKVLGQNKYWPRDGEHEKVDVSEETPNKKLSDYIIKVSPNISGYDYKQIWQEPLFEHEFMASTNTKAYKYWFYNNTGSTLNSYAKEHIWMEVEYVSAHNDGDYVKTIAYSTQTNIAQAADADDWDYLEVTGITPAIRSIVRVRLYVSAYFAATFIYIDPKEVHNNVYRTTWSYGKSEASQYLDTGGGRSFVKAILNKQDPVMEYVWRNFV